MKKLLPFLCFALSAATAIGQAVPLTNVVVTEIFQNAQYDPVNLNVHPEGTPNYELSDWAVFLGPTATNIWSGDGMWSSTNDLNNAFAQYGTPASSNFNYVDILPFGGSTQTGMPTGWKFNWTGGSDPNSSNSDNTTIGQVYGQTQNTVFYLVYDFQLNIVPGNYHLYLYNGFRRATYRLYADTDADGVADDIILTTGAGTTSQNHRIKVSFTASSTGTVLFFANATGANANGQVTHSALGLYKDSTPLPVELASFKAQKEDESVLLTWQTASELNNLGYHVQRSPDARHWTDLGFVDGAGTTAEEQRYEFADGYPLPSLNYYRLRQTDFDGRSEYSPIVIADAGFAINSFAFFPNPAPEGITSLYFPESPEGDGLLEVFDWLGKKVYRQAVMFEGGGEMLVPLDLHHFPSGTYTVTLTVYGRILTERLVVAK